MSDMWKRKPVEKYNWFFLDLSSAWVHISLLCTLLVIALSTVLFITYGYLSDDLTPDSFVGYTYAIVGTLFMLLAALSYSLYRRSRKRILSSHYPLLAYWSYHASTCHTRTDALAP